MTKQNKINNREFIIREVNMDETSVFTLDLKNGKVIMTNKYRLAKTKDGEFVLQQYYEYYNSNDGYWSTLDTELLEDK